MLGPAPDPGSHPEANTASILSVELPELPEAYRFPEVKENVYNTVSNYNFQGERVTLSVLSFKVAESFLCRFGRKNTTRVDGHVQPGPAEFRRTVSTGPGDFVGKTSLLDQRSRRTAQSLADCQTVGLQDAAQTLPRG